MLYSKWSASQTTMLSRPCSTVSPTVLRFARHFKRLHLKYDKMSNILWYKSFTQWPAYRVQNHNNFSHFWCNLTMFIKWPFGFHRFSIFTPNRSFISGTFNKKRGTNELLSTEKSDTRLSFPYQNYLTNWIKIYNMFLLEVEENVSAP